MSGTSTAWPRTPTARTVTVSTSEVRPPRRNARYTVLDADGPLPLDMIRGVPRIRRDALGFLARCVERHGDLVAFPLPRTPVLLVNRPDAARQVLIEDHRSYGRATIQYTSLAAVTGAGLLTSDGELWRTHRRVAQPAFHHGRLEGVVDACVAAGDAVAAEWDAAGGRPFEVQDAVLRATLDVVGRTLLGSDLRGRAEAVVGAVEEALRVVVGRAQSPLPVAGRRLRRARATIDALVGDVVAQRRADPGGDDLLGLLLGAGLSDTEVRDEIVTAVIAGHETVAAALTWTLGLLARAPEVQAQVREELDAELGDRAPAWADVPRLSRTRAVVDEGLRLYPPAWVMTRKVVTATSIAGVDVPVGTLVMISPWLMHRRAQEWPDPERFDPSRFEGARTSGLTAEGSYLPFGAGTRLCIGRDLALTEAVLVLARVLRGREVSASGPLPTPQALVTLHARGGMWLSS